MDCYVANTPLPPLDCVHIVYICYSKQIAQEDDAPRLSTQEYMVWGWGGLAPEVYSCPPLEWIAPPQPACEQLWGKHYTGITLQRMQLCILTEIAYYVYQNVSIPVKLTFSANTTHHTHLVFLPNHGCKAGLRPYIA